MAPPVGPAALVLLSLAMLCACAGRPQQPVLPEEIVLPQEVLSPDINPLSREVEGIAGQ